MIQINNTLNTAQMHITHICVVGDAGKQISLFCNNLEPKWISKFGQRTGTQIDATFTMNRK